jgi:voltage-gated potassium channel
MILVAALSNDSDNLFVALAARELNPKLVVIARGEDKSIETRMLRAGVDRVVYPAQLGGGQIARLIAAELGCDEDAAARRRLTDVMGFELQVYRNFETKGTTVGEIVARTGAIHVVAHIDANDVRHQDPDADHRVAEGDAVVLVTTTATAPAVKRGERGYLDLPHDLSVGIPSIDEEHRSILELVHRLEAAGADRDRQVTREVLADLKEYTVRHFKHEEALLHSVDYPELEEHIAEHRDLARRVDQLLADSDTIHHDNLAQLLDGWVKHHIMEVDMRYAEHVAGRHGPGATAGKRHDEVPCPR